MCYILLDFVKSIFVEVLTNRECLGKLYNSLINYLKFVAPFSLFINCFSLFKMFEIKFLSYFCSILNGSIWKQTVLEKQCYFLKFLLLNTFQNNIVIFLVNVGNVSVLQADNCELSFSILDEPLFAK